METNWAQREPAESFVIVLYLFVSLSVWVSCYCTWEEWGAFHMSVPRGLLSYNPSMHVCLSMPALRVWAKQVEYSEALHIYECVSVNTEGQMSLAGFFHWNTSPEIRPVWQSLPSLPPSSRRRNKKTSELFGWGRKITALCAAGTALRFHKVSDRRSGALLLRIASSPARHCRHCSVAV